MARPLLHPQTHVSVPTTLLCHHLTHIVDSSGLWSLQTSLLSSTCMSLLQTLADLPVLGHLTWLSRCRAGSNSNAQAGPPALSSVQVLCRLRSHRLQGTWNWAVYKILFQQESNSVHMYIRVCEFMHVNGTFLVIHPS